MPDRASGDPGPAVACAPRETLGNADLEALWRRRRADAFALLR
jgi:hypothetical protein